MDLSDLKAVMTVTIASKEIVETPSSGQTQPFKYEDLYEIHVVTPFLGQWLLEISGLRSCTSFPVFSQLLRRSW